MAPQCTFTLPSGQKCRCAATRNQKFCRHHAPKMCVPPSGGEKGLTRIQRWGGLHRMLPAIEPSSIPFEIYDILEALLSDGNTGISDREAGRLLRGLLRRLGSIPFPFPAEPNLPAVPLPLPPQRQQRVSPATESDRLMALLTKIGPGAVDRLSDEDLLQAWSEVSATRPSLTSTRPSSHQTQPSLNQTRPSTK